MYGIDALLLCMEAREVLEYFEVGGEQKFSHASSETSRPRHAQRRWCKLTQLKLFQLFVKTCLQFTAFRRTRSFEARKPHKRNCKRRDSYPGAI